MKLLVVVATLVALTACGSSSPAGSRLPVYEVRVGQVSGLGKVLVDGAGRTVYAFMPDRQSGHSVCVGACAAQWPPVTLPNGARPLAGPGVSAGKLSTTNRAGGARQLVYDGWPLYTWIGDTSAGVATGEALNNLGGLWYVLSPAGRPVRK